MTATICESTGKLGTVKCSESKWSNDFIGFILLVRSITVFFMTREKQNNYNWFIKADLSGKYTPESLMPLQPSRAHYPLTENT